MAYWLRNIRTAYAPLPPKEFHLEVIRETEKAFLFRGKDGEFWAPRSACTFVDGPTQYNRALVTFPKWFEQKTDAKLK